MSEYLYSADELKETSEYLEHYGMPRRSGRYPWGSGENPYQHSYDFIAKYDEYKKQYGKNEKKIAEAMGIFNEKGEPYINGLRLQLHKANYERRLDLCNRAKSLKEDGYNNSEIARIMGYNNESSVRSLLNEQSEARMNQAMNTAHFLKAQVDEKGMIDVGKGTEKSVHLHVSETKLKDALYYLELEGYKVYTGKVPQPTNPDQLTTIKVLCKPGTEKKEIYDYSKIGSIDDYTSQDNGETFKKAFVYPESMDGKRLAINYKEDGGADKDGLIELRRGVEDISLGNSTYAQVRILVNGTHYLKGMAVYSDDLPPGIDVRFNTNKTKDIPVYGESSKKSVLKPISHDDPNNPFGSLIKEDGGQRYYDDPNGKYVDPVTGKHQSLSLINKRAEEGDWSEWRDVLPSQFLSKQSTQLAKKQLGLALDERRHELAEIKALDNPTVKKQMLETFADECDKKAVHLDAASMPRQKYQVILPLTTIKETEVYAPNYENGERVALIRYPHGGTFEIPILTVNNNNHEGIDIMGKSSSKLDAIGIRKSVADKLSGADFDGDTVMVIPVNERNKIVSTPSLPGLKGFDPGQEYPGTDSSPRLSKEYTQKQMGLISNLITDMTIKGATDEEKAKAVKHSMVIIDANKHGYDWKKSENDNDIDALKHKYQLHPDGTGKYGGASTLISKAKSEVRVDKRQGSPRIGEDGSLIYKTADDYKLYYQKAKVIDNQGNKKSVFVKTDNKTGEHYYVDKDENGKSKRVYVKDSELIGLKTYKNTTSTTAMAEADDARKLISEVNSPMERLYADYANGMKTLAKEARKALISTGNLKYNPEAKKKYAKEVESLDKKLYESESNAPKERRAIFIVNSKMKDILEDNPTLRDDSKMMKKIRQQLMTRARLQTGASRHTIKITDSEWNAIQAGAISDNKLKRILNFADIDILREKATPRSYTTLSLTKQNQLKSMQASGKYSIAEMAKYLDVSTTTIKKYLNLKED